MTKTEKATKPKATPAEVLERRVQRVEHRLEVLGDTAGKFDQETVDALAVHLSLAASAGVRRLRVKPKGLFKLSELKRQEPTEGS